MQKKPADHDKKYPERTLESLNARYQEFLKDGANRKNQAQYENVVGEDNNIRDAERTTKKKVFSRP